jgi:secreted PhoX family phosphatase
MSDVTRRRFLQGAGAITLGFVGLRSLLHDPAWAEAAASIGSKSGASRANPVLAEGYGELIPDPKGLLDLPRGFSYHAFSRTGDLMNDGLFVPGRHDGMAAFRGPRGRTILVRNHEMQTDWANMSPYGERNVRVAKLKPEQLYDYGKGKNPQLGGTTTLVYNTKTRVLESHFLSLAGTCRNCAGGPTPWNSWITCEETVMPTNIASGGTTEKDHGYNFEVPARAQIGLAAPVPLRAMGRFNHEAIAVDARSGIVYQTEDREDGLIYRFIPNTPGKLANGGRLQALKFRSKRSVDTRNWDDKDNIPVGSNFDVEWIDVEEVESPKDDLRHRGFASGAARFARGEGMWTGDDGIYFACTNGGLKKKGQIWRYVPSRAEGHAEEKRRPGKLQLWVEPNDGNLVDNADNLTVAPWGDVVVCEDGGGSQYVVGVTPKGRFYRIARNAVNDLETAGATFSPDGSTLFFNLQQPGVTLAITGPWRNRKA